MKITNKQDVKHLLLQFMYWQQDQSMDMFDDPQQTVEDFVDQQIASYDDILDVLHDLVNLKRHKELKGKTDYYNERQPEVWKEAKEILRRTEQI